MELVDFKIDLYDFTPREYKPRGKRPAGVLDMPMRKMYSFTLDWQGLIKDRDPLYPASYIGSQCKGCMFFCSLEGLDWGYPRTTTGKGNQITPHKPNVGLREMVLAVLLKTKYAEILTEEMERRRMAQMPDPEADGEPRDKLEIS